MDIDIRKEGRIGRITLMRPKALNALTYQMCLDIEAALDAWATDDTVTMILLDAEGDRAFCAGGDIQKMYDTARAGDFDYGRKFWRDEYRMNAKMFEFPKPVAALLRGFTMGGGVGVGCHGSHRIVGDTSCIAMPECGIGLVPDVGGSMLLANARGRCGEYLGTTAARMDAGDAIYTGFADYYIPENEWPDLTAELVDTGDWARIDARARPAPNSSLQAKQGFIDSHFAGETFDDILRSLHAEDTDATADILKAFGRNSPLAMACTVQILHRVRGTQSIRRALEQEYRFTHRSAEHGDFIEGIRAAIIDKDKSPKWKHCLGAVPPLEVTKMLMPVPGVTLFKGENA